jgi:hypothetical protein
MARLPRAYDHRPEGLLSARAKLFTFRKTCLLLCRAIVVQINDQYRTQESCVRADERATIHVQLHPG